MDIEREEDRIHIILEYTMEVNEQQMNVNRVEMEVISQGKIELYNK